MDNNTFPSVGIVIPNFNGKHHLDPCLDSLARLEYPQDRIRIIIVDNGSVDESVRHLRAAHPRVQVQENGENLGFSAACNLGARLAANCEIIVFLNNDMRVEPAFLRELVQPIQQKKAACTAARILSWDGSKIDYAGSGMAFHGIGFQKGHGEAPKDKFTEVAPTLFACGGAMAISRALFESAGGFDEDFFAYYEDADLGWRLWVLGHTVLYIPTAVCYHHHSATSRTFPAERVRLLQIRNPILAIIKNYGEGNLERALAGALLLAVRRGFEISGVDVDAFRIEKSRSRRTGGVREVFVRAGRRLDRKISIPKNAVADFVALADVGALLPKMVAKRRTIQNARRRPDEEILGLFSNPLWCVEPRHGYRELQHAVLEFLSIRGMFEPGRHGGAKSFPAGVPKE